eukprot:SAG22_NODE_2196_length_2852_cov_4.193244_1_plen_220_part_10
MMMMMMMMMLTRRAPSCNSSAATCGHAGAFFWRLAVNAVQLSCIFGFWAFVPKQRSAFSDFGARTMVPYLLHPYALMVFSHMGIYDTPTSVKELGWRRGWLTATLGDSPSCDESGWCPSPYLVRQLGAVVVAVLITVGLSTKLAARLAAPVTNPLGLLQCLVRRDIAEAAAAHAMSKAAGGNGNEGGDSVVAVGRQSWAVDGASGTAALPTRLAVTPSAH